MMADGHIEESVLNDYADGLLSEPGRRAVAAHLAECAACAVELAGLQSLLATLGQAPRQMAPVRDLRPDIAARTATLVTPLASWRGRSVWSARYALAAAAVVLVVFSSLLTRVLVERRATGLAVLTGAGAATVADSAAAFAAAQPMPEQRPQVRAELVAQHEREFAAVEAQYARATEDLLGLLKHERSRLTPEAARALDRNIRVIDRAIAETRAALHVQPDDAALRSLVRDSYARKLELLRSAAQSTL